MSGGRNIRNQSEADSSFGYKGSLTTAMMLIKNDPSIARVK